MVENDSPSWLVLDGYEDEPAAFGVPPYVGFHIRYVCGVLEQHNIEYTYMTIDQWRLFSEEVREQHLRDLQGFVCIAGAVVPGRYIRVSSGASRLNLARKAKLLHNILTSEMRREKGR